MTTEDYRHYNFSYYNSFCTLSIKYVKCSLGDIYEYNNNHYICKTCAKDTYSLDFYTSC